VGLLAERTLEAGDGRFQLSLGEPEERKPRLRLPPQLVGLTESFLGRVEVADAQPDLPHLVERLGGCLEVEFPQLVAGAPGFLLGLRPGAAKAHHLGPVHPADARKAGDRLPLAPPLGRLAPLARPAVVAELLAGGDHVAEDDPCGHRPELTGHRCRGALVEQGQALVHLPLCHQRPPPVMEADRLEVTVGEPLSDLHRVLRLLERKVEVAHALEGDHPVETGQVAVLHGILLAVQQPLRLADPSASH
jgi:hypothetical protein